METVISDTYVANDLTISGGTINNTPIGASTPSTGVFTNSTSTNLVVTATSTLGTVISGTWNGSSISSSYIDDSYLLNTGDTATGDYNFDSNTLVIDSSTDRVGVGTDSPDDLLHVFSNSAGLGTPNANYNDVIVEGNTNTGISIFTPDNYYGALQFASPSKTQAAIIDWKYDDNLMQIGTINSGANVAFYGGNFTEALRINSSGNVGIGTTTPDTKLEVVGSTTITGDSSYLLFNRDDGLTQIGKMYDDSGFTIEGKSNNNLILRTKANTLGEGIKFQDTSSNNLMFIDGTNGRVGIGTDTPEKMLHIQHSNREEVRIVFDDSDSPRQNYIGISTGC
jgi:hypothetical protein